ncbi:MAG: hypothetical protein AABM32_00825 [Chloroflexota bacterium]
MRLWRYCAVALIVTTLACRPPASSPPPTPAPGSSCEYIGARFTPPTGWAVKEESDGEAIPRITLIGWSGSHEILASVFARKFVPSAEPTPSDQARAYFQKFRAATADQPWTDIIETSFEDAGHTYPALAYRERHPGAISALDVQQDTVVLLFFPNDFPAGGYFYPFFWTDTHLASAPSGSLGELRALVASFSIKSSPVGAPSKGCGLP